MEPQDGQGPDVRNNLVVNRKEKKKSQEGRERNILGNRRKGQVASHNQRSENPTSKHGYAGGELLLTSPKGILFLLPPWETYRHLHIRKAVLNNTM